MRATTKATSKRKKTTVSATTIATRARLLTRKPRRITTRGWASAVSTSAISARLMKMATAMALTVTRNSHSGVSSAVEEASGYALVLNQLFSHTRQIRPRKVLRSLTLFKFFPDPIAAHRNAGRMKLAERIDIIVSNEARCSSPVVTSAANRRSRNEPEINQAHQESGT